MQFVVEYEQHVDVGVVEVEGLCEVDDEVVGVVG